MRSWENQYIQLVSTKPEVIVAERDRETPVQSRARIAERKGSFEGILVEIGSGSGMHLLQLARQHPTMLCVGLEIRFKRAFKTGEKAERDGLKNVLVIRTDARYLDELFQNGEVSAFFINYPDPWDKRRWKKNRILNERMLDTMYTLLKPTGIVRYKTDHREYFESTLGLMSCTRWQITKQTFDLLNSSWAEQNIPTEFECLFKSQSKPLHLMEAVKQPPLTQAQER